MDSVSSRSRCNRQIYKAVIDALENRRLLSGTGLIDVQFVDGRSSATSQAQTGPAIVGSLNDSWNQLNIYGYGQNPNNPALNTPSISNVPLTNVVGGATGVGLSILAIHTANDPNSVNSQLDTLDVGTDSPFISGIGHVTNLMAQGLSVDFDPIITFSNLPAGKSFSLYVYSDGGTNSPNITSTDFTLTQGTSTNAFRGPIFDSVRSQFESLGQSQSYSIFFNLVANSSGQAAIQIGPDTALKGIINGMQLQPAGGLVLTSGPQSITAGTPTQVTASLEDQNGVPVDDGSAVSLVLTNQSGVVVSTIAGSDAQPGLFTFNVPAITTVGFLTTIVSDPTDGFATNFYQGSSDYINVIAGPASKLFFSTQPTSGVTGSALPEVDLSLQDQFGNPISDGTTVSLEIFSGGPANLSNASVQVANGVASFKSLSIDKAGTYQLDVSDGTDGLGAPFTAAIVSNSFNVTGSSGKLYDFEFRGNFFNQPQTGAGVFGSPTDPAWNSVSLIGPGPKVGSASLSDTTSQSFISLFYNGSGVFNQSSSVSGLVETALTATSPGQLSLSGLISTATYNLVLYSGTAFPNFSVSGAGASGGGSSLGSNYVEYTNLIPTNGSLSITFFGQVNGFQLQSIVSVAAPTTVSFSNARYVAGQQENVSATVSVTSTGAGVTAGSLTFIATDESATLPQVFSPPLSMSSSLSGLVFYNFASSLIPGQWLVNASYTGDSTHASSSALAFVTVGTAIEVQFTDGSAIQVNPPSAVVGSATDIFNANDITFFGTSQTGEFLPTTSNQVTMNYSGTAGFLHTDTPFASTLYKQLMESGLVGPGSITFNGLNASASYNLYLYSGGDSAGSTQFLVNGSSKTVNFSTADSTFTSNVNYVEFPGVAANSSGSLTFTFNGSLPLLNGIQLQYVSATASAATGVAITGGSFTAGTDATASALVTQGSSPVASGSVTFLVFSSTGALLSTSAAMLVGSNGSATYDAGTSLPAGSYSIEADYSGASGAAPSSLYSQGSLVVTTPVNQSNWQGGGNPNQWNDPANWSNGHVPGPADDVVIGSGFGTIVIPAGSFAVHSLTVSSPVEVTAGATLSVDAASTFNDGLTIDPGGEVVIVPDPVLVVASSLNILPGGVLDLGDNDMIVKGSTLSGVSAMVATGLGLSTEAGSGVITSSVATPAQGLALAVLPNTVNGNLLYGPTGSYGTAFDGQVPAAADILIKSTRFGDADFSGSITATDYIAIDNNFNLQTPSPTWADGDFNYDGVINGDDYTLIDNAFNSQAVVQSGAVAKPQAHIAPAVANAVLIQTSATDDDLKSRKDQSIWSRYFADGDSVDLPN